tara:strand:+ start:259 stop:462 length:204 start_codon:yes stop_codon:yes gene_type:complete
MTNIFTDIEALILKWEAHKLTDEDEIDALDELQEIVDYQERRIERGEAAKDMVSDLLKNLTVFKNET